MIHYKVAFVLQLVDDYNGISIKDTNFQFHIDGESYQPLKKKEGLYVFLEPMKASTKVTISGISYHECSVIVEKQKLNPVEPIAAVRLYGKAMSTLPYTYEIVSGKLENFKEERPVVVIAKRAKETGIVLKEIKQIEESTYLVCNGFTKENLLGKAYALQTKTKIDVFILTEKTGINEYRIEGHLKGKHIAGTPIQRVYQSITDEAGHYMIPVEVGEADTITSVIAT